MDTTESMRSDAASIERQMLSPMELDRLAEQVAGRLAEKIVTQKRLVDRHELAKILGISTATLDRQLRDLDVPHVRIGRRLQFDPERVIEFFSESKGSKVDTD